MSAVSTTDSTRRFPGGVPSRIGFRAAILVVLLLSWWWIVAMARDMYGAMDGPSAWMMTSVWDVPHLLLLWSMWAVMMAAMMLPSAWPMLSMYGTFADKQPSSPRHAAPLYLFAGGYVLVWAAFSVLATIVQRLLASWLVLSPMMVLTSPRASAALLTLAGVYQVTPLKQMCLRQCRSPITALAERWREGTAGAFQMGVAHGLYCLGCCWALMLLLFAGGVMNLVVILSLTGWVAIEKLAPFGRQSARAGGVLLLTAGIWMLTR